MIRLSNDLRDSSVRQQRKPVSRIAEIRALGVHPQSPEYLHPSVDLDENSYAALRGLTIEEMKVLLQKDHPRHICRWVVGIREDDFVRGCAVDFLIAFLLSITTDIQHLESPSRFPYHNKGPGPMHTVPLLQDLASAIVKSGLVDSTDDALTIVVPAFATNDLLSAASELTSCCI